MIEINDLRKNLGGKEVLNIERLVVPDGSTAALLGENGCGKTTLLRILAGVLPPDRGVIGGTSDILYLPQKPYAFHMPVWKSVTLGLKATRREKRAWARAALSELAVSDLENKPETALSGGESQKAAFARMLLMPSSLLLLDEPTSAVDGEGVFILEDALKRYMKKYGCTLIFATHSTSQATRLADFAVLLKNGRVAAAGNPKEIIKMREEAYLC